MKNLTFSIIIGLLIHTGGFSQSCLPEGITFFTQDEIDNFQINYPNCRRIEGDIHIDDDPYGGWITNLNGLSVLTSVGGSLYTDGADVLYNVNGLDNITSIGGDLSITYLYLNSLAALDNLTSIGGDLIIQSYVLNSLTGLNNLSSIGGDLKISTCLSLTSLSGLNSLASIRGNFNLTDNNALNNLTGLENLTFIGGDISLIRNDVLTSLSGLENIDVDSVGNLEVYGNPLLSDCEVQSICAYLESPNGSVSIYDNATGCNNPTEVASGCGITLSCLPFGNYWFSSQSDVDNFQSNYPDCSVLGGDVTIEGDDIINLNGLIGVNFIESGLRIKYNPMLTDLTGLNNLTTIGGLLLVSFNSSLPNLIGLNNVTSVGGLLRVTYNSSLLNLNGLESVSTVDGSLEIENNNMLTELKALNNLTSVDGRLMIDYNPNLQSLEGIDNIDAGSITYLWITHNGHLSVCDVKSVCDYLANHTGIFEIGFNATGCANAQQISIACDTMELPEQMIDPGFSILYNARERQIVIRKNNESLNFEVNIYNQIGQRVLHKKVITNQMNVSSLKSGVYIVELVSDKLNYRKKLMINN